MTDTRYIRRTSRAAQPRRPTVSRIVAWSGVAIVLLVVAAGLWIGPRAVEAQRELQQARALLGDVRAQALAFDADAASATVKKIRVHTARAAELTGDPVWRAAELVPWAGANLAAVRQLAAASDAMVGGVVTPLVGVAGGLNPAALNPRDGAISLEPFVEAAPAIEAAHAEAVRLVGVVDEIDTSNTIAPVTDARAELRASINEVMPLLATLDSVVPMLSTALGGDGPRAYVVMFQNPAESRALGGTALSFALLRVDGGRISLDSTVAAAYDNFTHYASPVIDVPDGAEALYQGALGTSVANSTVRPSFTSAARTVHEIWQREYGYSVDGILSIDPIALSYVVGSMGPITVATGDTLTADNLVPFLLNEVYVRFSTARPEIDNRAQDAVYAEVVAATFGRLTAGETDASQLLDAIGRGWNERRVLYWSSHADEQEQLVALGANGELPVSDAATDRIGLYFTENVGSKMNFFLHQAVRMSRGSCSAEASTLRVTVDLENAVDPNEAWKLASSVSGQWESQGVALGNQRMIVMLYAPPRSTITAVSVDGVPTALDEHHDGDYPVARTTVTVPAGGAASVSYEVTVAGAEAKALEVQTTPMVNPTSVEITTPECATEGAG